MKRISVEPWLTALQQAARTVRGADSAEGAHDFRVAIARLRVWLKLGGWHLLDDDLKALRDSAAKLRNFDAQLERSPPEALAERWRGARAEERQSFLERLDSAPLAAIVEVLEELPPVPRREAKKRVAKLAKKALASGSHPRSVKQVHALRRALRSLRYAQEWLDRDAARLSEAQGAAGAVVDASVAIELSEGQGGAGFRDEQRKAMSKARKKARKRWRAVRAEIKGLAR